MPTFVSWSISYGLKEVRIQKGYYRHHSKSEGVLGKHKYSSVCFNSQLFKLVELLIKTYVIFPIKITLNDYSFLENVAFGLQNLVSTITWKSICVFKTVQYIMHNGWEETFICKLQPEDEVNSEELVA